MSTAAQQQANKETAQHSSGPWTEEGRRGAAQNNSGFRPDLPSTESGPANEARLQIAMPAYDPTIRGAGL